MIELVALDIAGTTIDDHGLVYQALRLSVEETGAPVSQPDLQRWMGVDKVEAITALMKIGGVAATAAAVSEAFDRFRVILAESYLSNPPIAMPGVDAALGELRSRGVKIALTTGFTNEVTLPLLESVGWAVGGLLDAVVTTSDVAAGRPAPYLIHHAMELTGVLDVHRVLAAGDTVVDVLAAHNAGALAVGVLTGALTRADFDVQPCDYVLDSIADLPSLPELA